MAHPHLLLLPSMKDPGEEARARRQNESSATAHPAPTPHTSLGTIRWGRCGLQGLRPWCLPPVLALLRDRSARTSALRWHSLTGRSKVLAIHTNHP